MTITSRRRIVFVATIVILAQVVSWIVFSDLSPLAPYFLWHPAVPNAWTFVNLPGMYLGVLASGNIHQASVFATVLGIGLQWALLAVPFSLAIRSGLPDRTSR
jgi:Na+/H+-dicarboxylate symporter